MEENGKTWQKGGKFQRKSAKKSGKAQKKAENSAGDEVTGRGVIHRVGGEAVFFLPSGSGDGLSVAVEDVVGRTADAT